MSHSFFNLLQEVCFVSNVSDINIFWKHIYCSISSCFFYINIYEKYIFIRKLQSIRVFSSLIVSLWILRIYDDYNRLPFYSATRAWHESSIFLQTLSLSLYLCKQIHSWWWLPTCVSAEFAFEESQVASLKHPGNDGMVLSCSPTGAQTAKEQRRRFPWKSGVSVTYRI